MQRLFKISSPVQSTFSQSRIACPPAKELSVRKEQNLSRSFTKILHIHALKRNLHLSSYMSTQPENVDLSILTVEVSQQSYAETLRKTSLFMLIRCRCEDMWGHPRRYVRRGLCSGRGLCLDPCPRGGKASRSVAGSSSVATC